MIAAPAVDVRGGRAVQLVGGRPDAERVSLPDPARVAEGWWSLGFGTLHVVDLDAALGSGDNLACIEAVLQATAARTQVGGGVRDDGRAETLLAAGADRVVVGTRALDDPAWLDALAGRHPGRVVVAADARGGEVLRRGWTESSGVRLAAFLARLAPLPLAGVLATDVGREGRLEGVDRDGVADTLAASAHPVWISGGVSRTDELVWLEEAGAAGVVLGMALYAGALDAGAVASRWGGAPVEASAGPEARAGPEGRTLEHPGEPRRGHEPRTETREAT